MDSQVALRPVSEDDLPTLEELTQDPEKTGEFAWFGWLDRRQWWRRWEENGLIGPDGGTLMVVRGGDRLGFVNWRHRVAQRRLARWGDLQPPPYRSVCVTDSP
jgi:hypothetical protein